MMFTPKLHFVVVFYHNDSNENKTGALCFVFCFSLTGFKDPTGLPASHLGADTVDRDGAVQRRTNSAQVEF